MWALEERMVSRPEAIHISKTTRRLLRDEHYKVTFDTAFAEVVKACAEPRSGRLNLTWIRPDIVEAYKALHAAGIARSVGVWDREGILAGGLYGVAIGEVFFTESMLARQSDASKVGLVTLSRHLQKWGFVLNGAKRDSLHLRSLGFTLMPRATFNAILRESCGGAGKAARGPSIKP